MIKYNLKSIMQEAYSIRLAYAQKMNVATSSVIFAECLKLAWKRAKNTPDNIRERWEAMTDEHKISYVKKAANVVINREVGESNSENDGNSAVEHLSSVTEREYLHRHIDDFYQDCLLGVCKRLAGTWIEDQNNKRDIDGREHITFYGLVMYACRNAHEHVKVVARKDAKIGRSEVVKEDGTTYSIIDTPERCNGNLRRMKSNAIWKPFCLMPVCGNPHTVFKKGKSQT